ncbi:hypothetical protein EZS27_034022 [termite gut metagenome]|uniref:DUF3256 family protein n=1 Tax=termite gut metagenome TaxID=433724 RepID=A0A5J4Q1B0_9ZZZZ
MKKCLPLLMMFSFVSFLLSAQEAKELFLNIPDSFIPLLTPINRADFIDFLENNMQAQVKNKFEKKSEMTDLTLDYIRIQMTSQSTWQMKLLAVNDITKVICAISTACAPVCDSYIRFYSTDWKELPTQEYLLKLPTPDDFFQLPSDSVSLDEYDKMRMKTELLFIKADLSKTDHTLSFTFTTLDYMGKEEAETLKSYLREVVTYEWKEGKFQPVSSDREIQFR